MIEKETWIFINSFAPWVSGIGALLAVITSLHLAKRESIKLKLSLGIRALIVENSGPGHGTDYVWLTITNIGIRSATISQLYWKFNPFKKGGFMWIAPRNQLSSQFPISIKDGQSANYAIPIEEFKERFAKSVVKELRGINGIWKKYFAKFYVLTSGGNQFGIPIETDLWRLLIELKNTGIKKGISS